MNIQQVIANLSAHGATWVLWTLLALSVLTIAIILERAACFWLSRDDADALWTTLEPLVSRKHWKRLEQVLASSPSFEARILSAAVGLDAADAAKLRLHNASDRVRTEMERHLAFLGTLGSNAPFIGLLGTVIGIVGAFQQLDQSGGALTDGLMSEIGEALLATAVGLVVALPAVAFFNLYRRLVQLRMARAEALSRSWVGALEEHTEREHGRA